MDNPRLTAGVTQQKLLSLVSLWEIAEERLGISGFDVITIIEDIALELKPLIYLRRDPSVGGRADGLFRANLDGWETEAALIHELGTSDFAHWWTGQLPRRNWGYAPRLKTEPYLGLDDADAVLERINEIRDRSPERRIAGPSASNDLSRFPDELRAAIKAFNAVRNDPGAMRGKTPKQALEAWLLKNTELGTAARERVAMVANWQPTGGVPKTPG